MLWLASVRDGDYPAMWLKLRPGERIVKTHCEKSQD
jgi:hypothetical protein